MSPNVGNYVVEIRGAIYGPFESRSDASEWGSLFAGTIAKRDEVISWEVRPIHPAPFIPKDRPR